MSNMSNKNIDVSGAEKVEMDYLQALTLGELISKVNIYNDNHPETPILKKDIVKILHDGDTYILLYYK